MTGAEIALFFEKWGLELLLSGLGAVLTGMVVHYRKLIKKGKASEDQEKKQAFKKELTVEVKGLIKEVKDQVHAEIEEESSQVREEIAEYETNDGQRLKSLETRADILEDTLTAVADNLDIIKKGLLAVQGHEFRNKCRRLLRQELIGLEEYEQLESDHLAYNALGGNHKGDSLFDQVKTKYYSQLKQQ